MTDRCFFRAVLCQSPPLRVIATTIAAIAVALAGCGGAVASPLEDGASGGPTPSSAGCPSNDAIDTGAAVGEACANEGLYCPETACDPCNANCRAVACTHGAWTRAVNTAICTGNGDASPPPDAGAPDSGVCIDIVPSSFDQTCTKDSECMAISPGTFCEGAAWCTCPAAAINVDGQGRYQSELQQLQSLKPGPRGCSCPYFGAPRCVASHCTICGGAAGACPDGG